MREPIFTTKRRDLLAKTAVDLVKILIAAGLASEFFSLMPWWIRVPLAGSIVGLLMLGIFVCPKKEA